MSSKSKSKKPAANDSGAEEEGKIKIGNSKFVSVSQFRGKSRVDIREYYLAEDGTRRPGKKGISLSFQEWENFKEKIDDIQKCIDNYESD